MRYALYKGVKGCLVGHPSQAKGARARYACQQHVAPPEGAMVDFGLPGYTGPELHECYEPTELVFAVGPETKILEKAVAAGKLTRGAIIVARTLADAQKRLLAPPPSPRPIPRME